MPHAALNHITGTLQMLMDAAKVHKSLSSMSVVDRLNVVVMNI